MFICEKQHINRSLKSRFQNPFHLLCINYIQNNYKEVNTTTLSTLFHSDFIIVCFTFLITSKQSFSCLELHVSNKSSIVIVLECNCHIRKMCGGTCNLDTLIHVVLERQIGILKQRLIL